MLDNVDPARLHNQVQQFMTDADQHLLSRYKANLNLYTLHMQMPAVQSRTNLLHLATCQPLGEQLSSFHSSIRIL